MVFKLALSQYGLGERGTGPTPEKMIGELLRWIIAGSFAATVLSIPHVLNQDIRTLQSLQRSDNNFKRIQDSEQVSSFEEFATKVLLFLRVHVRV